jgi:rod shape-determining protein MreD
MTGTRAQYAALILTLLLGAMLQAVPLPDAASAARPSFVVLALGWWAYTTDRMSLLLAAWISGLCLDALFNTALGAHALALVISVYLALRLRGLARVISMWQATLVLVPVWLAYSFILFWIDGVTLRATDPAARWLPVLTTALAWPLVVTAARLLRPVPPAH